MGKWYEVFSQESQWFMTVMEKTQKYRANQTKVSLSRDNNAWIMRKGKPTIFAVNNCCKCKIDSSAIGLP